MEKKRVAVKMEGQIPNLRQIDQTQPLAAIIESFCQFWNLQNSENYALQWEEAEKSQYVTERNRGEIKEGDILVLTDSPTKMVQLALDKLSSGSDEESRKVLQAMSELASDITYAQEFINKDGLKLLMTKIQEKLSSPVAMGYALKAFVELMDHDIVSWDIIEPKFIRAVASCVNITRNTTSDTTTLQMALEILEAVVTRSTGKYATVEQEVTPRTLTEHLSRYSNAETQKKTLALINGLFQKADQNKRKKIAEDIQSKTVRTVILNSVIRRTGTASMVNGQMTVQHNMDPDMLHQLYILQCLILNLLQETMMKKADPNDQNIIKDIVELRRLAFDPDGHETSNRRQNYVVQYKKLGFKNHANPVEDFMVAPPGVLALNNMIHFAKHHQEDYTRVILENTTRADDHDLPFASASIELTKALCEILNIGVTPTDDGQVYYAMMFTDDNPMAELYCVAIQLLNKTWKEMRAAAADFPKVLEVAREQITRTLQKSSDNFERFKTHLWSLSYSEITKIWQEERKVKEQGESQAQPIIELRDRLKPDILELIKQQRLAYLVEGTQFSNKYRRPGKLEKYWYCCLSPNHKLFYHGECEGNVKPATTQLKNKLAVVDIKGLLLGKDCPHFKDKDRKHHSLFFSIQTESELGTDPLNFFTRDIETISMWTDGINALLGNEMVSELKEQELEMLLSMEIKLRLLDTEGIKIPEVPPPIPDDPPNYDFAYNSV